MTAFRAAHSGAMSWAEAAKDCALQLRAAGPLENAGEALGFVYASDAFAGELARIVRILRESTGVAHWVGSLGIGVLALGKEYFDEPGLAVMVAALPSESFRIFETITESLDGFRAENASWIAGSHPSLAVVHGDPRNPHLPDLLDALSAETACFLVGGLTSSRGKMSQVAERVTQGGLSGVLFSPKVAAATGLSQGCSPIGPVHTIDAARDNVIFELDGRPALEVLKQDAGERLSDDPERLAADLHAAILVSGSDTGDYMVRNLVGAHPELGWLAIGHVPAKGDRVMFCRRDGTSARHDLVEMLARARKRAPSSPKGAVYYSCVARGPNLFGPDSAELRCLEEALGPVPLVGFFCNGEICNTRLYGYTSVLALFC
jgi:small ligand-binding sensory domain FIST